MEFRELLLEAQETLIRVVVGLMFSLAFASVLAYRAWECKSAKLAAFALMFYIIAYTVSLMLMVLGGLTALLVFGMLQFVAVDELTSEEYEC